MGRGDARMGTQLDRPGRFALSSAGHGRAVVPVHGHEAFRTAPLFSEAKPIHSVARSHLLWVEVADLIPGGFGPHYCPPKRVAPPT